MVLDNPQLNNIKDWFTRKIESLEKDSYRAFTDKIEFTHTLGKSAAPFPIVLFCMSILDFFSAAYFGYSDGRGDRNKLNQTERMVKFLNKYLGYAEDVSRIALDIFRHKLVHLGEPHVPSGRTDNIIGWEISSVQADRNNWTIYTCNLKGDKIVRFGVNNFIRDLKNGILGQNGYFQDLINDESLQNNYLSFYNEIA